MKSLDPFFIFLGIALLFLTLVEFLPLGYILLISFTPSSIFNPFSFKNAGLKNYIEVINSTKFLNVTTNSFIYGFITAGIQTLIGLILALLLHGKRGRLYSLIKALLFTPYAIPYITTALVWQFMLDPVYGTINKLLRILAITSKGIPFLGRVDLAMLGVMAATIWQFTPFSFLLLLAAIESIPRQLIEASQIDGAGSLACTRYVILPYIKELVIITFFIRSLFNYGKFDIIWLMTHGGPLGATETFPITIWVTGYQEYALGLSAGWGVISLLLLMPFFVAYVHVLSRRK